MTATLSSAPTVRLRGLLRVWPRSGVRAVDHLDLDLGPGVHGLLGPNGAGKTTLIRLLTGEIAADQGTLTYGDIPAQTDWALWRSRFGYMPQQQQLYPDMSCRRFLMYMAALKGLARPAAMAEIARVLAATGLGEYETRRIGTLSGGMRQRLLISQALLGDPAILVLDEPTAGLDPQERIRIRNVISGLALDRIVLLATHIVSDIESIAGQVHFLQHGRIIRSGSPADLLAAAAHTVIECLVPRERLDEMLARFDCSRVQEDAGGALRLRLVGEWQSWPEALREPWITGAERRPPSLEDLYILLFSEHVAAACG